MNVHSNNGGDQTNPSGEGPLQKKLRTNLQSSDDEAFYLNQTGILYFDGGKDQEAEKCFSQALASFGGDYSEIISSSDKGTFDYFSARPTVSTESSSKVETEPRALTVDEEKPMADSVFKVANRQRGLDEGMHVYSQVLGLPLNGAQPSVYSSLGSSILLYNIGQTYCRRCRYGEALKWFEQALPALKAAHGITSTSSTSMHEVRVLHNLGHCYYRLGKNEEAMKCYQSALLEAQRAPATDMHISMNRNCVAVLHFYKYTQVSYTKALQLFHESLPVYFAHFGSNSKEVATVLNNLGRTYFVMGNGNDENALVMFKKSLSIRREVLGENAIDLAATIGNIGHVHQHRGELDLAMTYYEEFIELIETCQPSDQPRDATLIYQHIAEIQVQRRELHRAKIVLEKALLLGRNTHGPCHPDIASALSKLGSLHFQLRDLDKAVKYYTEGLNIERAILEPHHPQIVVSLLNIAETHRAGRNHVEALAKYKEVHVIQMSYLGSSSLDVARTLSSIGLTHYQLKQYGLSFESYQEALQIYRDKFGTEDREEIASLLNSIGLVLFHQRDQHNLAKACFSDSLRIRQKLFGSNDKRVAMLWYNIATIFLETGQGDVAIEMFKETLRIERNTLGEKHPDVIATLQHLGLVHQHRGELEEALCYFGEALDIERSNARGSPIAVGKMLNLIGNIHLQRANVGSMMECFVEASRIYQGNPNANDSLIIAGYHLYGLSSIHPPCAPMA